MAAELVNDLVTELVRRRRCHQASARSAAPEAVKLTAQRPPRGRCNPLHLGPTDRSPAGQPILKTNLGHQIGIPGAQALAAVVVGTAAVSGAAAGGSLPRVASWNQDG
jgi:hypothetical protein